MGRRVHHVHVRGEHDRRGLPGAGDAPHHVPGAVGPRLIEAQGAQQPGLVTSLREGVSFVGGSRWLRGLVLGVSGATAAGAAVIVRQAQVRRLELDDIGIVTDIDTVEDLARAERLLASR